MGSHSSSTRLSRLFMDGNHKPVIFGSDPGIWRRIKLIPFTVSIPEKERDKLLGVKFYHERSGILAWALHGCLSWYHERDLKEPACVRETIRGYRDEMDRFPEFLRDESEQRKDFEAPKSELFGAYVDCAGRTGQRPQQESFRPQAAANDSGGRWRQIEGRAGLEGNSIEGRPGILIRL